MSIPSAVRSAAIGSSIFAKRFGIVLIVKRAGSSFADTSRHSSGHDAEAPGEPPELKVDVLVYSRPAQDLLERGVCDLSFGFRTDEERVDGQPRRAAPGPRPRQPDEPEHRERRARDHREVRGDLSRLEEEERRREQDQAREEAGPRAREPRGVVAELEFPAREAAS